MLAACDKDDEPTPPIALSDGSIASRLAAAGIRATRQRLTLGRLIFQNGHRHFTAEEIHLEAVAARLPVSVATIYNTLRLFCDVRLIRSIPADPARAWFDTNVRDHSHYFATPSGRVSDIPDNEISIAALPSPPDGYEIVGVDVVVRIRPRSRIQRQIPRPLEHIHHRQLPE